jgi:acetyltransferase
MPDYVNVDNPLDITGIGVLQPAIFASAADALAADENLDVVVYLRGVPTRLDAKSPLARAWLGAVERHPEKAFFFMSIVGGQLHDAIGLSQEPVEPVAAVDGVPFLQGCTPGLKAVGALIRYAEFRRRRGSTPQSPPAPPGPAEPARAMIRRAAGRPLSGSDAREVLALYGIPVAREALATSAAEAPAAARAVGYPVALKAESPQLLHKTEAGAVLLDVADEQALALGYERVLERARAYAPGAEIRGVLVQEMVRGGQEVIVGMTRDDQFGPVVLLGAGGVFAEVLRDVSLRLPPLGERDVREMIDRLRAAPVLRGARGRPPADEAALVDVLLRFSRLCLDVQDLVQEIDVNPLVVLGAGQGAKAVDCLIVPRDTGPGPADGGGTGEPNGTGEAGETGGADGHA